MERLTEEKQIGPWASLKDKAEAIPGAFANYDCLMAHMTAVTRLKAYEDTGLTPEEVSTLVKDWSDLCTIVGECGGISRLRELAEADRAGRLVVLPCKVGDTVWFKTYVYNGRTCVGIQPHKVIGNKVLITTAGCLVPTDLPLSGFEKDWFLTREEAEKVLEAKRDD